MKTCIAYFSKTDNTKIAAEYLAEKIGAKIIQLQDNTNYKGFVGFLKGGMNASRAKTAALDTSVFGEISKYDRVILATPVWAGKTTPAINAVLENVDFTGKEVYVLTTQADPDAKDAQGRKAFYEAAVSAKSGKLMALFSLSGTAPNRPHKSAEDLHAQVDDIVTIG